MDTHNWIPKGDTETPPTIQRYFKERHKIDWNADADQEDLAEYHKRTNEKIREMEKPTKKSWYRFLGF